MSASPDVIAPEVLAATFDACRYHHTLRLRLEVLRPGAVRVHQHYSDDLDQAMGRVHGGVYAGLLDTASYYAALSACPAGEALPLTLEYKINLVGSARAEDLVANSDIVKLGRRIAVVQTRIETASGTLVAIGLTSLVRAAHDT